MEHPMIDVLEAKVRDLEKISPSQFLDRNTQQLLRETTVTIREIPSQLDYNTRIGWSSMRILTSTLALLGRVTGTNDRQQVMMPLSALFIRMDAVLQESIIRILIEHILKDVPQTDHGPHRDTWRPLAAMLANHWTEISSPELRVSVRDLVTQMVQTNRRYFDEAALRDFVARATREKESFGRRYR